MKWPAFPAILSRLGLPALLLAFALLYGCTLDTGLRPGELIGGDLITHQYAQVQGRPSNAPGYPLYTIGGWLWFRLGRLILGDGHNPIPILASYSTLWALIALWLCYRVLLELTDHGQGGNRPVALAATAFFGLTYFFWYYAITTEQYTSAVAWTLAILLTAFRWQRRVVGAGADADATGNHGSDRYLILMAFLVGVALAHMLTLLLVVPPLLWLVLRTQPAVLRRHRLLLACGLAMFLPLVSYTFVYAAGAARPEWRGAGQWSSTWDWFWSFIATQQGRDELTWSLRPLLTAEFPALIWGELTWPGLVAGAMGLILLRDPWAHGARRRTVLLSSVLLYLLFCWIDRLGNWYQVIMPVYALLAVGMGVLADRFWSVPAARRRTLTRSIVLGVLIALAVYRGLLSFPRADAQDRPEDTGLAPGWAILADAPPHGAAVLGAQADALALDYISGIWGKRTDLRSVTSSEARRILLAGDRPLVVTEGALGLVRTEVSSEAHFTSVGNSLALISLAPARTLPDLAETERWQHRFSPELTLFGGRYSPAGVDRKASVTLFWLAAATPAEDWSVSVRLEAGGAQIAQTDQAHPVLGAYPMTRWSAGEVVTDTYALDLPADAGPDRVTVILYQAADGGGFVNLGVGSFPLVGVNSPAPD